MGDEVRVTVIAAGFDRWDETKSGGRPVGVAGRSACASDDLGTGFDGDDDDFDVPPFLK